LLLYFEVITSALLRELPIGYEGMNCVVDIDGTFSNMLTFRIPYLQTKGVFEIISAIQKRGAVFEAIRNVNEKSVCKPQRLSGFDVILHPASRRNRKAQGGQRKAASPVMSIELIRQRNFLAIIRLEKTLVGIAGTNP